jgi:mono/diheme cytochrome c family protein
VTASATPGAGRELFELLRCQQCHVLGSVPADLAPSTLAPDLRMTSERLQPDWILDWLRSPLTIVPGTRMPVFWPEYPKSPYPQLGGDAAAQMRAIRDHLLTLRGGPMPPTPGARVADN